MTGALTIVLVSVMGQIASSEMDNLNFNNGLKHWKGQGFTRTSTNHVHSKDAYQGKALLYRSFIVPKDIGTIHFQASVFTGRSSSDRQLDIYLEASGRTIIPKLTRQSDEWKPASALIPTKAGEMREYVWTVSSYVGRRVRIVLVDDNPNQGRYLQCTGFKVQPIGAFQKSVFERDMLSLARKHKLTLLQDYTSRRFLAFSNSSAHHTGEQLKRCELMYDLFLGHFGRKGFKVHAPDEKLMVTIFDTQKGLEAYLKSPLPPSITGLFHPPTNRLVVYDYGKNRDLLNRKKQGNEIAKKVPDVLQKRLIEGAVERRAESLRELANISTIMHETAHQLSFNTGMLNRHGDVPLWLAEGLACYCESTEKQEWKGIGTINPIRLMSLRTATRGPVHKLLPLKTLIKSDEWFRGAQGMKNAAVGYAQSWALFRMLMEEQPDSLRRYLELIYPRRTDDHRLGDFAQIFGTNLRKIEDRHHEYIKRMLQQ